MAINPLNPNHRQRMARAVDFSYQELRRYGRMRDNTVRAYLGSSPKAYDWDSFGKTDMYRKSLPKGNLLQQSGLSMQIALAYGEPEYQAEPRTPDNAGFCVKLGQGLNRMSKLLDFGETARSVAADSFFGYGIFKCGVGRLPLSARAATGLQVGPCVWRVSQDDFLYDITAARWGDCAYMGDMYKMPLEEAIQLYPHAADRLSSMTDVDRLDSPHVFARPSRFHVPELSVWMIDQFFPAGGENGGGVVSTWPIRNQTFGELANEPIQNREWDGHWSGLYEVLNHLYAPDELVPVAQAESVKAIHYLFNDLLHLTGEQALNAKVNPLYRNGADRDMQKIWNAADRRPVGISDPTAFVNNFEVPGPTGSQTQYMAALINLFKSFSPTMDQAQRAPTATQGAFERQTTSDIVAEARRKFSRSLQLVGYKMGHLLMNDNDITLPSSMPVRPGSRVSVDTTWKPAGLDPRPGKIDDYDIGIEAYSTRYRSPEEKMGQLNAASTQIGNLMQQKMQGSPINVEEAVKDISEMSGLPQLKNWYEELDPMYQAQKAAGDQKAPQRLGVGQYTRTNVSEKTDAGALEQNLNNIGSDNTEPRFE